MRIKYRSILSYLIPLIVAFSLCVTVSYQIRQVALSNVDNTISFNSFADGLSKYKELRQEWRPRILSNFIAGRFVNLFSDGFRSFYKMEANKMIYAWWTAAWLFLISVLFIIAFKQRSLLYILGIFAGISFAYSPGVGVMRVYPWDMPALFAFCCFVLFIKQRRELWLAAFIPVAILLKETAFLMVIAFLFLEKVPWRRKLLLAGIAGLAGIAVKLAVDLLTGNPSPLLSMTYMVEPGQLAAYLHVPMNSPFRFEFSRLAANLPSLFSWRWDSLLFVDAGLLLVLLFLPLKPYPLAMFKVIALIFLVGNLVFGVITEYRIWFEMIPLALYGIDLTLLSPAKTEEAAAT